MEAVGISVVAPGPGNPIVYSFPETAGAAGQVLTAPVSGTDIIWANVPAAPVQYITMNFGANIPANLDWLVANGVFNADATGSSFYPNQKTMHGCPVNAHMVGFISTFEGFDPSASPNPFDYNVYVNYTPGAPRFTFPVNAPAVVPPYYSVFTDLTAFASPSLRAVLQGQNVSIQYVGNVSSPTPYPLGGTYTLLLTVD